MKKVIALTLALLLMATLVACSNDSTNKTTVPVTTTTTDEIDSMEYTPSDPEYYRDEYSETAAQFWAKSSQLSTWYDATMEEFSKNPTITTSFLKELEDMKVLYDEITAIVGEIRIDWHPEVTVKEFINMAYHVDSGYLVEPMQVLSYDDIWANLFLNPIYENGVWKQDYSTRYAEGLFEFNEDYYVTVEWMENFNQVEGSDDFGYRSYQVVDPTRDAFILYRGEETGYQLVSIKADSE